MNRPMFLVGASLNGTYAVFKDLATGEKVYRPRLANGVICHNVSCKTARAAEQLVPALQEQYDIDLVNAVERW